MGRGSRELWIGVGAGVIAGAVTAWLVWRYADGQLRSQLASGGDALTTQLRAGSRQLTREAEAARTRAEDAVKLALVREIQPEVRREIVRVLDERGITRARVDQIVQLAQRAGLM